MHKNDFLKRQTEFERCEQEKRNAAEVLSITETIALLNNDIETQPNKYAKYGEFSKFVHIQFDTYSFKLAIKEYYENLGWKVTFRKVVPPTKVFQVVLK